jgi:hypothetical protein
LGMSRRRCRIILKYMLEKNGAVAGWWHFSEPSFWMKCEEDPIGDSWMWRRNCHTALSESNSFLDCSLIVCRVRLI